MSIEHIDGQSLPFSLIDIIGLGRDGNRKLARCQPVGLQPLARIPHQSEPANCEELFYIFGSELWIVIEKKQRASASWVPRILDGALSLPFRIEEIPERSDGPGFYELCVICQQSQRKSRIDKGVLIFAVVIVMFAIEPFRRISDFRQNKGGADWLQRFGLVERCRCSASESDNIGEKFSRPSLGHKPLEDLRGAARGQDDFDLRKLFLESVPF